MKRRSIYHGMSRRQVTQAMMAKYPVHHDGVKKGAPRPEDVDAIDALNRRFARIPMKHKVLWCFLTEQDKQLFINTFEPVPTPEDLARHWNNPSKKR